MLLLGSHGLGVDYADSEGQGSPAVFSHGLGVDDADSEGPVSDTGRTLATSLRVVMMSVGLHGLEVQDAHPDGTCPLPVSNFAVLIAPSCYDLPLPPTIVPVPAYLDG